MKVLVTGATGMVGANLVRALLENGDSVRVLVREKSDRRALEGLDVEAVTGDVCDAPSLRAACDDREVLYHAAAVFSYQTPANELHRVAVGGTLNAIDAAKDASVKRVVLTSSSVTLGSTTTTAIRDEASVADGEDMPAYYLSKVRQESAALERAGELGVDLVVACPGIVVGPHDYRLTASNEMIFAYWEDPFSTTWPGGCNIVSARDVAAGHVLVARKGESGQRYFLGSENWEWSMFHRTVAELSGLAPPRVLASQTTSYLAASVMELTSLWTGKAPRTTREQARAVGRFYWYSHEKVKKLGYQPMPARAALADTIAWMIVRSPHVDRALRARLRPSADVLAARELFL